MSQPSIALHFKETKRKRAAGDDFFGNSKKAKVLDQEISIHSINGLVTLNDNAVHIVQPHDIINAAVKAPNTTKKRNIQDDSKQRVTRSKKQNESNNEKQQKLIPFILKGSLSPKKKCNSTSTNTTLESGNVIGHLAEFLPKGNAANIEKGLKTPTKQDANKRAVVNINDMSLNEIKKKINGSSVREKLKLTNALNKVTASLDRLDQMKNEREAWKNPSLTNISAPLQKNLEKFSIIEVEVPISPRKEFTTPTKIITPSKKNELMSPRQTVTPCKLAFSPCKEVLEKEPAYLKYQNLVKTGIPTLQLPYKYRFISEMFKCMDTVCAMFYNRKEKITFKKLKPAMQRMLRKNVHESHFAQIHNIYPNAYKFTQEKTRNYGSETKHETYQLVITPIAEITDEQLSPAAIIKRSQIINHLLIELVQDEHEKFLLSLDPPVKVSRAELKRWHANFPLESCADIKLSALPQPPNVETFSSAQTILSTARNLFNCGTSMEKALDRLEEKRKLESEQAEKYGPIVQTDEEKKTDNLTDTLLKGVPKSLLEKIRAKQAAKALDAMTRRPSQDEEAVKYGRLPEIARHVRNVFVTEKKGVLTSEAVLAKISNSYKGNLTLHELEEHLKLIAKEIPSWILFMEVRNCSYIKISKSLDTNKVIVKLENLANSKT